MILTILLGMVKIILLRESQPVTVNERETMKPQAVKLAVGAVRHYFLYFGH